jgi:hypothetical protein
MLHEHSSVEKHGDKKRPDSSSDMDAMDGDEGFGIRMRLDKLGLLSLSLVQQLA